MKWKAVFNADGYEVRIYDKDDVLFSEDIYKATSYEIDESEWGDYPLYAVIPYKKIEGKKAYSKAALETRAPIPSDKNTHSSVANNITYRIEDQGKTRDDQLAADLGALLARRSLKKADKTDNPTYRVNLQVSNVVNPFVKNGVEMIDIYPTVNIEIFLSANSTSVYQYTHSIEERSRGIKDNPSRVWHDVYKNVKNDLENNFLKHFDDNFYKNF